MAENVKCEQYPGSWLWKKLFSI